MNQDFRQWKTPHFVWDSIDHFKESWNFLSGVHTVFFEEHNTFIDFYINEHVSVKSHLVQPVIFTGAIHKREEKTGPFFSGLGITKSKNLPLIAIADPSIDQYENLSLAWYTGGPTDNFVSNLVTLLKVIQDITNRQLLFAGGSGGGFAALNFSQYFENECTVLIWNPQTDIFEYNEQAVKNYLRILFNFAYATLNRNDWKNYCKIRTDKVFQTNILQARGLTKPLRLVYLQNASDWHYERHLKPIWTKNTTKILSTGSNFIDNNHGVFVDEFSSGHSPVPATLITGLLEQLMQPELDISRITLK